MSGGVFPLWVRGTEPLDPLPCGAVPHLISEGEANTLARERQG